MLQYLTATKQESKDIYINKSSVAWDTPHDAAFWCANSIDSFDDPLIKACPSETISTHEIFAISYSTGEDPLCYPYVEKRETQFSNTHSTTHIEYELGSAEVIA